MNAIDTASFDALCKALRHPDQPGKTMTRSSRLAAEHVRQAVAKLSPWARREVLEAVLREVPSA